MNESTGAAGADFLGRIVDKALGRDGGLRPRVPSLFEPVFHAGIGMAESPQAAGAIGEAVGETLQPLRENDGVHMRHASRVIEAQPDQTATRFRPQESVQFPASWTEAVPAAHAPFAGARVPTLALTSIRDDHDAPVLLRPTAVRVPPVGAGDALQAAGVRTSIAAIADETATGDRRLQQNGALTPSFDRNAHAITAEPQAMRRRLAQQQPRSNNSAAGMEPVVNVTIGRVEVRAAVQPSPAPRRIEARGPRPMSLDDYLKRRGSSR